MNGHLGQGSTAVSSSSSENPIDMAKGFRLRLEQMQSRHHHGHHHHHGESMSADCCGLM